MFARDPTRIRHHWQRLFDYPPVLALDRGQPRALRVRVVDARVPGVPGKVVGLEQYELELEPGTRAVRVRALAARAPHPVRRRRRTVRAPELLSCCLRARRPGRGRPLAV